MIAQCDLCRTLPDNAVIKHAPPYDVTGVLMSGQDWDMSVFIQLEIGITFVIRELEKNMHV